MRHFAQTIFETGQSAPANEKIYPKSYLPGRYAVTSAVREISNKYRREFITELKNGTLQYGGAITIDGVHLKVQGKHFYDFTLHYMEISNKGPFDGAIYNVRNMTLLMLKDQRHLTRKTSRGV